jgi:hypothetical protein
MLRYVLASSVAMASCLLIGISAPATAGITDMPTNSFSLDVGNKSTGCAVFTMTVPFRHTAFDAKRTITKANLILLPGESVRFNDHAQETLKVRAVIWKGDCNKGAATADRYDNVPTGAASQLTIANQGSTFIMRHGR